MKDLLDLPPLKKPVFHDLGPREWTPRVGKAVLKVEFLRTLIPRELLQEIKKPESLWDSLTGKQVALILRVHARIWMKPLRLGGTEAVWIEDNVWIDQDGSIITERGIRDLLEGKTQGYEHLAGQWEKWAAFVGIGS